MKNHTGRAVVIGSGPNGLTAAALLARKGWQVDVYERNAHPGGAAASAAVLGEGTVVDLGAAGHPFGVASPAFRELRLTDHGLHWAHAEYPMAHPLPGRPAAVLHRDLNTTAVGTGKDAARWRALHRPLTDDIDANLRNLLAPVLRWPAHPLRLARFGPVAAPPASWITGGVFGDEPARALFSGSAAHAITPLHHSFTGAFGALFGALGMTRGWPVARGGSQTIVDALVSVLTRHGGSIHTNHHVGDLRDVGPADAIILNLTPAQVLRLRGLAIEALAPTTRTRLRRWRYGIGVHKVDYLLDGPIPWTDARVGQAGTVHVVGSTAELHRAEAMAAAGRMPTRPFVMLSQQQVADPSRASGDAEGRTVVWAYAHVPHGYAEPIDGMVSELLESQIERFAPGFRDRIIRRVATTPAMLEKWNSNLIGGDVAGGAMTGLQALLRPGLSLSPHRLSPRVGRFRGPRPTRLYLASGSTPPGAGVHGMPGFWAARAAQTDLR